MMRHEVHVDRADLVFRTHERVLLVPIEIAHDDRAKGAVPDQKADGLVVFGIACARGNLLAVEFESGAGWVDLSRARKRLFQYFSARSNHSNVQSADWNRGPWGCDDVLAARANRGVRAKGRLDLFALVDCLPVIDNPPDRQTFGELGDAAHMVHVEVGHHEGVNLFYPGFPGDV